MGDWTPDEAKPTPFPQADPDRRDAARADKMVHDGGERGRDEVFVRFHRLLEAKKDALSGDDILHLVIAVLGDRATVNDGAEFIYRYARTQGYDIPPYPLAGCGQIKEFFHDNGVRNVPEWYGKIGIGPEAYRTLHQKNLIVVRNAKNQRKAFAVDTVRALPDDEALELADAIMSFVLADAETLEGDSTLF